MNQQLYDLSVLVSTPSPFEMASLLPLLPLLTGLDFFSNRNVHYVGQWVQHPFLPGAGISVRVSTWSPACADTTFVILCEMKHDYAMGS